MKLALRLIQLCVLFPWEGRGQLRAGSGWPVGTAAQTPLATVLPFSQLSHPLGFPYDHVTGNCFPKGLWKVHVGVGTRQEGEAGCPPAATEVSSASQLARGLRSKPHAFLTVTTLLLSTHP